MPRKAKSRAPAAVTPYNTGDPQPPAAPTNMPYGAHQASIASQQQVPLAGPASAPAAAPGAAPLDPAAAEAAAAGHPFEPIDLMGPTNRPSEPVTHGLPSGPGGGPDVLRDLTPRTADTLEQIAQATGDPFFTALANRARLGGQ